MNPINSLLKFFGLEDLMEVYPKYLLNVQYFIDSDKDAISKYSSLRYIKDKLTSGDIQSIIDSDIDRGVSFFHCFCYLPEDVKSIYASSISHQKAMELMKGFMEASLETVPPHYTYPAYPSPLPFLPENILSVDDWHKLCSINTEAIPQGLIPQNVLDDPRFWNNYVDFIGKGNYPKNLLFHPSESFDESLFNYMPKVLKSDFDVQVDLLSKGLMHPKNLDTEKLTKEVFLKFPPRHYKMIPEELKKLPEFVPLAENAIKADIASLIHIPVEVLNEEMVLQGIKNFKDQLKAKKEDGNYLYTPLEFRDVMEYLPEHLQTVNVYKAAMEIYPESVGNISYAFPDILENISLEQTPERPKEKEALLRGESIHLSGLTARNGRTFDADVSIDPESNKFKYGFPEGEATYQPMQLTEEQQKALEAGEKIRVERLTSKAGKNYDVILFKNPETGKIEREWPVRDVAFGVPLSPEQKAKLQNGEYLWIDGLKKKDGTTFKAPVVWDAKEGKFGFKELDHAVTEDRSVSESAPSSRPLQLSEEQQKALEAGEKIRVEGLTSKAGKNYNIVLFKNPDTGKIEKEWAVKKAVLGVEPSQNQRKKLQNGEYLWIDGLKKKDGTTFKAPVIWNAKEGKFEFAQFSQDKAKEQHPPLKEKKEITPASEHQVQVDRNTKGFRKEENKYSEKPVLSGKQTPADVEEQHKRKVNKLKM